MNFVFIMNSIVLLKCANCNFVFVMAFLYYHPPPPTLCFLLLPTGALSTRMSRRERRESRLEVARIASRREVRLALPVHPRHHHTSIGDCENCKLTRTTTKALVGKSFLVSSRDKLSSREVEFFFFFLLVRGSVSCKKTNIIRVEKIVIKF